MNARASKPNANAIAKERKKQHKTTLEKKNQNKIHSY